MFRKIFLLFVPLLISPVFAFAYSIATTTLTQDALLYSDSPTLNDAGTFGMDSNQPRRGILTFTVPTYTGTAISAKLTVKPSANYAGTCTLKVHNLTNDFLSSEVTWNKRNAITNWSISGGDYESTELKSVSVSGGSIAQVDFNISSTSTAGTFSFPSGATVNLLLDSSDCRLYFNGSARAYGASWNSAYIPTLEVYYDTSSSPATSTPFSSTSTIYIPATLYSSQLFVDMATTTTYGFMSTIASTTKKQAGLIFITHATSSSPTITWGGDSMNFVDATDDLSGYRTSLFILNYPDSDAPVIVSGIASGTVKYLYQSVWSNADVHRYADKEKVLFGTEDASLSIPSPDVPATVVGSMFTMSGLSGFDLLAGSAVRASATSSTGDMSITSASCNALLDDCSVGYTRPWSFVTVRDGVLVGISLSATSTFTYSSSSPSDFFGEYGTNAGFTRCLNEGIVGGISCVFKNLLFWTLSLIVPTADDVVDLQDKIYETLGSDNSVASAIFLIPINLALFTATSTAPTSTPLTIAFPRSNGTYPVYSVIPVHTSEWAIAVDNSIASILTWILGFVSLIFVGKLFIRLFHI